MAIVRKKLLAPGRVVADGKAVDITRDRIAGWVSKFRALKADGVKFPVPWGHFKEAGPDSLPFCTSRFNAGYVADADIDPADGGFVVSLDCPGLAEENGKLVSVATLPNGATVKTAIAEVSAGIWDRWADGRGRQHDDILGHVALCTHPVAFGTGDFIALSAGPGSGVTYFSTGGPAMAKDKDDDNNDGAGLPDEIEQVTNAAAEQPDGDEMADGILNPPAPAEMGDPAGDRLKRVLGMLAEGGMVLPPDTTAENFVERLETACGVLLQSIREQKAAQAAEMQAAAAPPAVDDQTVPEGPPATGVMLSTLVRGSDPASRLVKSLLAKAATDRRAERARRIDALRARGLPDHVAEKLLGAKLFLSTFVDPATGDVRDDETDRTIGLLEQAMPSPELAAIFLSSGLPADVKAVASPITPGGGDVRPDDGLVRVGNMTVTKAEAADIADLAKA